MKKKKRLIQFKITLVSHYTGRHVIYECFESEKMCENFCRVNYNFFKAVFINGKEFFSEKKPLPIILGNRKKLFPY